MSSSYKTNYLGLNRFVGTDHPKMEDVNFDNQTIDAKFQEHIESKLHITEEERQQLGKAGVIVGSYTGDGSSTRTITLEEAVGFGVVFASGESMVVPSSSGPVNLVCGDDERSGVQQGNCAGGKGLSSDQPQQQSAGREKMPAQPERQDLFLLRFSEKRLEKNPPQRWGI